MGYECFDRLMWLMSQKSFTKAQYVVKWERTRQSFFRDLAHLRDFYDVEFKYNRITRRYERTEKQKKKDDKLN